MENIKINKLMNRIQKRIDRLNRLYKSATESRNDTAIFRINALKRQLYSEMAKYGQVTIAHLKLND